MITRRDITIAMSSVAATLVVVAVAAFAQTHPPTAPILGPATFDWDKMTATKTDTGEVRSLYRGPTATLDELEMHVTTLNPGNTSHPPHQHVNEELVIIREGTVETLSNGKWVRLGPGSVIFNASNSLHGLRNVGTTPAVYHVVNWSPNKAVAP
ncbi:cupin domain-containing protein [Asticcacaulis solisilvae]|uniref:cupin domain-containing protein n=1 Tax=Asticcacaulis solisilvae TaxID=1217274 RepID=UPI003FD8BD31